MAGRLRREPVARERGFQHLLLAHTIPDRARPRLNPNRVILVVDQVDGNPVNVQFEESAVPMVSVQDDVVILLDQQRLPHEPIRLDGLTRFLKQLGEKLFVGLQEAGLEEGKGDVQAPTSPARREDNWTPLKRVS